MAMAQQRLGSLARAKVKPRRAYKRVLLVTPDEAMPLWRELFSHSRFKIWPLSWEGRAWIEHGYHLGALQTRIVRRHWPNQSLDDEWQLDPQLAVQLLNQKLHVLECRILDNMISRSRGRLLSGATVLTVGMFGMLGEWWRVVPWYVSLAVCVVYAIGARVMLKGGFGNVAIAKMVCGVSNPFILTRHQLLKHIEGRKELVDVEGAVL